MQSSLLRLAVALLAFGLGVSATTLWIAYRMPEVNRWEAVPDVKVVTMPTVFGVDEPPPPPAPPSHIMGAHFLSGIEIEQRVISKPAPVYPSTAVAVKVSGTVEVWVMVDETGRVGFARALSGNPLLQEAAVDAAYQARFAPALLDGLPVKVSGFLDYNFVLP